MNTKIKINVKELLRFFDEKPNDSLTHATSIVSIAGEDLSIGLLNYYLEKQKENINIKILFEENKHKTGNGLPITPTIGRNKGPRLDRWMEVTRTNSNHICFQIEIKNWSAHAIGGEKLKINAESNDLKNFKIRRWNKHFEKNGLPKDERVKKVLIPMKKPNNSKSGYKLLPLIIFWETMHPIGGESCFFPQNIKIKGFKYKKQYYKTEFKELWIFSISSYLRTLNQRFIELDMPIATKRIEWINRLFEVKKKKTN